MPTYTMLIGVPGSGKSSWRQANAGPDSVIISSDDIIEDIAKQRGQTYSEVFSEVIDYATDLMAENIKMALANGQDVIHDQTNLRANTRVKKLRGVPDSYKKVAVFFPTPDQEELTRRLNSRHGKTIPDNIVKNMCDTIQMPTRAEGFDQIIIAKNT
jgi:predicted kinase